jgi:hypothetical protein
MALVSKTFGDIITFTRASTATFTGSNGLIQSAAINAPRFDYDPVTLAAKGLLIEEQRTNLLTYSEDFSNAAWQRTGSTITANTTTAPDGNNTADVLVEDTSNGTHRVFQSVTVSSSTAYTQTVFVKAAGRTQVRLLETSLGGAIFDLSAVSVISSDAGITASISSQNNGWYRCRITATTGGAQTTFTAQIQACVSGANVYIGNGADALYMWGAQLEAGAFATSYIPTVASQVTRSADVASVNTLSPWYNATEGTLYAELQRYALIPSTAFSNAWALSDNTNNERFISYNTGSIQTMDLAVTDGGVAQAVLAAPNAITANTTIKTAFAYAVNDFAFVRDAGTVQTDTSGTLPTVDRLYIGANSVGTGQWTGYLRRITYYPRRLSNAELQAITV